MRPEAASAISADGILRVMVKRVSAIVVLAGLALLGPVLQSVPWPASLREEVPAQTALQRLRLTQAEQNALDWLSSRYESARLLTERSELVAYDDAGATFEITEPRCASFGMGEDGVVRFEHRWELLE